MGRPWERIRSQRLADYHFFQLRQDTNVHPERRSAHDFYIFEFPHWVNIIPLTAANEVVFIRQFRHGTREVTLEVPGGIIDAGESPKEAALRELREETGYSAADAIELGWVHPNPAIQENRCYTYLAENVTSVGEPKQDGTESIEVALVPLEEVVGLFEDGTITHALVVTAFHLYQQRTGRSLPWGRR